MLSADECDSSVGDCLGFDHTEGEGENKYSEKLNDLNIATVKNEEKDSKTYEQEQDENIVRGTFPIEVMKLPKTPKLLCTGKERKSHHSE